MILYHSEGVTFRLAHKRIITRWIRRVIENENCLPGDLNYIFCKDTSLSKLNNKYLKNEDLTDVLAFETATEYKDFPEVRNFAGRIARNAGASAATAPKRCISGDVYISIQRVRENAGKYGVSFAQELHRVMVHAALHLAGYSDKNPLRKKQMKKKEDYYLELLAGNES